jgi:outer membrane lipoprotein SlyB
MTARKLVLVLSVSAVALISACSSSPQRSDPYASAPMASNAVGYGNVSGIEVVSAASRTSGGGAVLGAVLGAVVGNQIGSGSGRAAATGLGAVGGAVIGNTIETRNKGATDLYRVTVRMDNGTLGQFDYQQIDDLRVGDRVRVESGQLHRV